MINVEWGHFMRIVEKFGLPYSKEIYESIKDKLHITKFTFELSDNNYHLKNVELED